MGSLWAGEAEAQFAPQARPAYGYANLRSGFMPDPHVMRGNLGGTVSASQINSSCRGHITPQPSHVIRSRTGFRNIRFVVNSSADATLMVMLPSGQILCNDDGGLRMNPLIETSAPAGDIRVWVGAYSQSNSGTPYSIGFSELSHVNADSLGGHAAPPPRGRPPVVHGPLQPTMPPSFGQVNLTAGFMPDPHVVSGTAGGPIQASSVGNGCRGYVSPQPNHVLMTGSGFSNIRLVVNGSADTTLVVMLPNGQIVCDDDGGSGTNPLVSTSSPPGPIRVWVGTYRQGTSANYNIGFSELGHVGTNNIPAPGGGQVVVRPPGVQPPVIQPPSVADIVQMQVSIPVTLMGPGMTPGTVALWNPRGGPATQITLSGRSISAGGVTLGSIPPSMRDPVVTVTQRRNGTLLVRAEQPPMGRGDRGEQMLLLVRWAGRPTIAERWSGTAVQRGPRWSR
ncbi:MAG: hypothetical protein VYE22_40740 [Myxococcota bacterium]|nr:hypothetical protein [Myxococcota bacterium]